MRPYIALIVVLASIAIATALPLKGSEESKEFEILVKSSESPSPLSIPLSPSSPKTVSVKYTVSDKIQLAFWIIFLIVVFIHQYQQNRVATREAEQAWKEMQEALREDHIKTKSEGSQLNHDI
ncbi:hypothetical protein GCK72_022846 [Caenorhabditis remanei]|uniref:Uncharacterized protein n=1 Tax=Caenorhabditis remanei TaxID=31234 RepID=A0A6A5FV01_CAERE|nr:hypothetical protein GCK72_022846 [Caenorhabditis remanei]KAF1746392.1 hypothetical protein GCK72_022846 [Caenorhabditis remanei]